MTIAAVLCWYDEPVEFLDRCIRSLAGVCDRLTAVDGAWLPFPDGQPRSPLEQRRTVNAAACAIGIEFAAGPVEPDHVWASQVAKRDAAMRYAGWGADWLLVIDGDEYVSAADRDRLEQELAATDRDVALVRMRNVTGNDFLRVDRRQRRIFRAGTTVERSHQGYTLNEIALAGDTRDGMQLAAAVDVSSWLTIEHTPRSRGVQRNRDARTYRHARARAGER
jgi:hypothetical protein